MKQTERNRRMKQRARARARRKFARDLEDFIPMLMLAAATIFLAVMAIASNM